MSEEQDQRLNQIRDGYEQGRLPYLLTVADDPSLSTKYLIDRALDNLRKHIDDEDWPVNFPLLILQRRSGQSVLDSAYDLVRSENKVERTLGAQILKEHPDLTSAPQPHSEQSIGVLAEALAKEPDEDVVCSMLVAVGWQKHPSGIPVLMRFKDDPRDSVRWIVSNCLLMNSPSETEMPEEIGQAFLQYVEDPDPDVQWSVFWEMAEHPQWFLRHQELLRRALQKVLPDLRDRTLDEGERALQELQNEFELGTSE